MPPADVAALVKSEPDPTEINSVEVVLGRLPSIRVLIVSTCMVLAVPLVWIGYDSWTAAQDRVSAAQEATESAHRLESLLRLAPALHAERMSASASAGTADFVVGLSPGALGILGLDFVSSVDDDREVVDRLLAANGDVELESEVRSLRAAAAADELTVYDLLEGYDQLAMDIAASIDDELGTLTAAAASAGDDDVATAARVAEAAAGLQLAMAGQDLEWGAARDEGLHGTDGRRRQPVRRQRHAPWSTRSTSSTGSSPATAPSAGSGRRFSSSRPPRSAASVTLRPSPSSQSAASRRPGTA